MDSILFQINQKPKSKGKPGLPKTPTDFAVVTKNGLEDDFNNFRNFKKDNDPNMALMLLSYDIIKNLNMEGWPVKPGDLGENLTFSNIEYSKFAPSQQYSVGEIEMEICFICDPCMTLKHLPYIGNKRIKDFIKTLLGRRGWYAKVLKPGKIKKGDLLRRI